MNFPKIMGCPCAPINEKLIFEFFEKNIGNKGYTVAINAKKIHKFQSDITLRNIINKSLLPYPDGAGAVLGLKWIHGLHSQKINMPSLSLEYANKKNIKTFIVGSTVDIHKIAIEKIKKKYPNLKLVGNSHGYNPKESIINNIVLSRPALILVALGSPRQEMFAAELQEHIDFGLIIGCGGALDIISGNLKRAPTFMINNNLEWLYRIKQEPLRLKQSFFLFKFTLKLMQEILLKKTKYR